MVLENILPKTVESLVSHGPLKSYESFYQK